MTDQAFTVEALAERWSCSTDIIYSMLRRKELKGFKIGAAWRISAKAVQKYEEGDTQ